jgi:hypothetical protein
VRARRGSFDTGSLENYPNDRASVSALHEGLLPIGASSNLNGKVSSKEPFSGTYSVKADGTHYDDFIAPDGSMLTFVQTKPSEWVSAAFEQRGTAKRVGD